MSIVGIESIIYGVGDVAECVRFFKDFGLTLDAGSAEDQACFTLPEGSHVVLRHRDDPRLPQSKIDGDGVREVVWGVRDDASCESLVRGLQTDRAVELGADGAHHFMTDFGLPMALKQFSKLPVLSAPDPLNSPGNVNRLNQHRKWIRRAVPKTLNHVVYQTPEYEAGYRFMCERLNFRLTDSQKGFGKYLRADGSNNHHSLLLLNSNVRGQQNDNLRFHHANFGVEDIDEVMVGANYMTRRGWPDSKWGLGRHRIDSSLFYYLPSPTGGEAEYGADADVVDDSWVPRNWINPLFGHSTFVSILPPFLADEPAWEVEYITDGIAPSD